MSAIPLASVDHEPDLEDLLRSFSIFKDLPQAVTDAIKENADHRRYDSGHTVFSNGQFDASEFFVILSGKFRLSLVDPKSGTVMIEEYAEGAIFGLELSVSDAKYDFLDLLSATADGNLQVLAIDSETFRTLASNRPSLMRNIAANIASELSAVRFDPARSEAAPHQRVYAALLDFVERDAATGKWRIEQMPKHRHLADKASVDEVVTADAVAHLIQEGIAQRDYPGMIINDMSRLNELSG